MKVTNNKSIDVFLCFYYFSIFKLFYLDKDYFINIKPYTKDALIKCALSLRKNIKGT